MSGGLQGRDRAVAARLRDGPKELERELRRQYRTAARDAAAKTQAAITGASSKHAGPLREEIAQTVSVSLLKRAGTGLTVAISSIGSRMPDGKHNLPAYADAATPRWARWRHPVWGNEEVWVSQNWPSARGWFTDTLQGQRDALAAACRRAVDEAAAKLGGS